MLLRTKRFRSSAHSRRLKVVVINTNSDPITPSLQQGIRIALAEIVIGIQDSSRLPYLASAALIDGVDSPLLREAAGMAPDDYPQNLTDAFLAAAEELDFAVPDGDTARELLAAEWARQIISGEVTPRAGTDLIWKNVAVSTDEDKYLIFAGLGDAWDSYPEQRGELDREIITAAVHLVRST